MFDHSVEHEAWNDSDSDRVLLFIEFCWPLPGSAGAANRAVQSAFGLAARGLPKRIDEFERVLNS